VAIYHLTAKVISREKGRSAVAAASYRAAACLHDDRLGEMFNYTSKQGVQHTEILAPEGVPAWVCDRERLWNVVEACEKRKDAQLAREIEIALPRELDAEDQIDLLRDFVQNEFVARGMVADFALHRDNLENPHAHILLTFRRIGRNGFGLKERSWNARSNLRMWRAAWMEVANVHLARAGLDIRIDHRTLEAQEIDLIPGRKIGISLDRQQDPALPRRISERVEEQRQIAQLNGERILSDPTIALRALTHQRATFTKHDIARFLNTRTDGPDQFRAALLKVMTSPELAASGHDERDQQRYTTRGMLELEEGMLRRAELMTLRLGHETGRPVGDSSFVASNPSSEQAVAFQHIVGPGDLKVMLGVAGSRKSLLLAEARAEWEAAGWTVKGAALSGIAAENVTDSCGIPARTLASYELAWKGGRDPLTSNDVLIFDEAAMLGSRQMATVLEAAEAAHAKVVLVGDPEQLQAIEAGASLRGVVGQVGAAELNQIGLQNHAWQQEATRQFAKGATTDALAAYASRGGIIHSRTREEARSTLVTLWAHDGKYRPEESRLMLAFMHGDVHQLNELARDVRRESGELGNSENIETEHGTRQFAVGDRLCFLKKERSLSVKNGSFGTVELVSNGVLQVRLDRTKESMSVDTRFYRDLDHGYAATVCTSQSTTVDRSYVLATPHFDRHSTYLALSRHREAVTLFYGAEDFAGKLSWQRMSRKEIRDEFTAALSRARPKDLAHDYLEPSLGVDQTETQPSYARRDTHISMDQIDAQQQAAAESWREKQRAQELNEPTPLRDHSADLNEPLELPEDDPPIRNNQHELSGDDLEEDLGL
jgi:Ti-type conjugative transfer relaxase TraA